MSLGGRQTRLELDGIAASYGGGRVLHGLSLDAEPGELIALLGPSGCGKTTALKVIAGLLAPEAGEVRFNGRSVNRTPAERREAAMVFQKPLLFPHLTVAENVAFGLRMRRTPASEARRRIAEALELVRLEGLERRLPRELSGGQEQRAALARAIVTEPRVLLLDEPFSALDERLRGEMRVLVRRLQRELRITAVFVTHDQEEASEMADRLGLLLGGTIEQFGPPRDFYAAPRTAEAARFFGWQLIAHNGRTVGFRPETASITRFAEKAGGAPVSGGSLEGSIEAVIDRGTRIRYDVRTPQGQGFTVETAAGGEPPLSAGERVRVDLRHDGVREF